MASGGSTPRRESVTIGGAPVDLGDKNVADQVLLLVASLMEGGQEDEEICRALNGLTKILGDSAQEAEHDQHPVNLVDSDGFDTLLGFLDMRQHVIVRSHATLTVSAYMKASGQRGPEYLSLFFKSRIKKPTYDDLISAFSVATSLFPIVPDLLAEFFLSEGFVQSLGPLMKRKWPSKKVEQAALEMLNAACMNKACREAIAKYCSDWLEEILSEESSQLGEDSSQTELMTPTARRNLRIRSENVKNLAAVVLAKVQIGLSSVNDTNREVTSTLTSIDELSDIFSNNLSISIEENWQHSIEGLAYVSLQPNVKEKLAYDAAFLKNLISIISKSPAKSPLTYGGLSILVNLTVYQPNLTEEQKRISQLKAYANASGSEKQHDPFNDDEHVAKRCRAVFEASVIPMLVTHSQHGSTGSLALAVAIIFSIANSRDLRGQVAQQGGVKLVLHSFTTFPENDVVARRKAAHTLALILISMNPSHIFGGSTPLPITSAIRPLLLLLNDDAASEQRNLLPVFESLLALANICSIEDDTPRNIVIRLAWQKLEELLLSSNEMISRATVELICNLVQSSEGAAKYGDGSKQASHRMHILLALVDSEDYNTRRGAGGALASLTQWDTAVNTILERDKGVKMLLGMCIEQEEELRHRGSVCVSNIVRTGGKIGDWAILKVKAEHGVEILKECLKKSRSQEVLEIVVDVLKIILSDSTNN